MELIEQVRNLAAEKGWTAMVHANQKHPEYIGFTWPTPNGAPARFAVSSALHIGIAAQQNQTAEEVLRMVDADLAKENFDPVTGQFGRSA